MRKINDNLLFLIYNLTGNSITVIEKGMSECSTVVTYDLKNTFNFCCSGGGGETFCKASQIKYF